MPPWSKDVILILHLKRNSIKGCLIKDTIYRHIIISLERFEEGLKSHNLNGVILKINSHIIMEVKTLQIRCFCSQYYSAMSMTSRKNSVVYWDTAYTSTGSPTPTTCRRNDFRSYGQNKCLSVCSARICWSDNYIKCS